MGFIRISTGSKRIKKIIPVDMGHGFHWPKSKAHRTMMSVSTAIDDSQYLLLSVLLRRALSRSK